MLPLDPLWTFRRAWSQRHIKRVTIACVGSSTTHGTGATTLERAWVNHLARRLGSRSRTYLPHHPGWTTVGAVAPVEGGLSLRSVQLAPGASLTRSTTSCNVLQVLYRKRGGAFTVSVDGSAVTTMYPPATSGEHYDGIAVVGSLPLGAHTVTITASGATPVTISGLCVVDTTHENGVDVVNAGLGGTYSASYSTPALAMRAHNHALGAHDPELLIMMIGSNDYALGTDPGIYHDRMRAAVLAARSACPRDMPVLLVHGHKRFDVTPVHPWDDYGSALYDVAQVLPDVGFLDLSGHFAVTPASDTAGLVSADGVHLSDAGHAWVGDLIGNELLSPGAWPPPSDSPVTDPSQEPSLLPGLVAAWDNTGLTGEAGDEVDWTPHLGTETAALTAPPGRRATLRLAGPAGRPTVVTTSTGRCLQTGPWSTPVTGPLTILAVVRPGAAALNAGSPPGVLFSGRSGRYTALNIAGDNLAQLFIGDTAGPGVATAYFGTGRWKVVALVVDGTTVSLLGHDNDPQVATVTPGGAYGLGGFTIGGNSGMAANIDAEWAEILVFGRALTATEIGTSIRHLARKHALDGSGRTSTSDIGNQLIAN
jgi:lysophospholipase L1-like esterase